jgi:hypothetical protein
MILLYFDDVLEFIFIFFIWHFFFKKILSTNGTAFFVSLNGKKKKPKQREKKMVPSPQLCTRGQEEVIDHGISHKLKNFHYHNTLAIST